MPIIDAKKTIDRYEQEEVDRHLKSIFIELKKAKTEPIFNVIKYWYRSYKPSKKENANSKKLPAIDIFTPKRIRKNTSSETVYGDIFAKHLIEIFKLLSPDFGRELYCLLRDMDTMYKINGNEKLIRLLDKNELEILVDALKLTRSKHHHKVKVRIILPRVQDKHAILVNYKNQPIKIKKEVFDKVIKNRETGEDSVSFLVDNLGSLKL